MVLDLVLVPDGPDGLEDVEDLADVAVLGLEEVGQPAALVGEAHARHRLESDLRKEQKKNMSY